MMIDGVKRGKILSMEAILALKSYHRQVTVEQ